MIMMMVIMFASDQEGRSCSGGVDGGVGGDVDGQEEGGGADGGHLHVPEVLPGGGIPGSMAVSRNFPFLNSSVFSAQSSEIKTQKRN